MSCNGCRVLRKGCSDTCILRPCLQWIETSEAQGHATVFLAKFFGRAGLMGFISAVPEHQRSALFQSLLYEACGRTVNPVFGAVGLLSSGNWQLCQAAVDTVLKGGSLRPPSPTSTLSYSAGCPPPLAMSEKFPFPSADRVEDPTQITSAVDSFDRQTVSLGIRLPEATAQEPKERSSNSRRSNVGWHQEPVHGQAAEPASTWQCDSHHQLLSSSGELRRDGLGYVAPRRVRARVEASPVAPTGSVHDELSVPGEQLELDLTLKVKGEKVVGAKRMSSPCDSVNSEGSVTSLDSTLREPSRPLNSSWPLEMNLMPPPYRQLLPLLH